MSKVVKGSIELVGMEEELELSLNAVRSRQPVCYYGFTGNGKTLLAWRTAEEYVKSLEEEIPIIYMQLYPEMTKNSLIGGETLKDGSIVIEEQSILTFGKKGAVIIIDECTHTTEPVLLAFNSLIEEPYSTVVGNEIYVMDERTRFIFCGNLPDHAGNIHLPASFANRLFIVPVEMPSKEILVKIGVAAEPRAPAEILDFAADLILDSHDPGFPVSPRNMVTLARSLPYTFKTGFKGTATIPQKAVMAICKKNDIDESKLRRVILSSLLAHWVCKSIGPDKVKSLLWEE